MLFAALYDIWHNKETGEDQYTYTIITTAATKSLEWIHDRMPAMLEHDQIETWLSGTEEEAIALLHPFAGELQHYPVSSVVGNVKNDLEECVKPIELKANGENPSKGSITKFFKVELKPKIEPKACKQEPNIGEVKQESMPEIVVKKEQEPMPELVVKQEQETMTEPEVKQESIAEVKKRRKLKRPVKSQGSGKQSTTEINKGATLQEKKRKSPPSDDKQQNAKRIKLEPTE